MIDLQAVIDRLLEHEKKTNSIIVVYKSELDDMLIRREYLDEEINDQRELLREACPHKKEYIKLHAMDNPDDPSAKLHYCMCDQCGTVINQWVADPNDVRDHDGSSVQCEHQCM